MIRVIIMNPEYGDQVSTLSVADATNLLREKGRDKRANIGFAKFKDGTTIMAKDLPAITDEEVAKHDGQEVKLIPNVGGG
jgi:hypothetical protein